VYHETQPAIMQPASAENVPAFSVEYGFNTMLSVVPRSAKPNMGTLATAAMRLRDEDGRRVAINPKMSSADA